MNRKLSATQILHGARAYSHNASRRAHQLSGPKRVRVMHGPVGDAALNDGIDSPCQHCGYQICSCGPCSTCGEVPYYCSGTHAYEPPKPSARALDNLPAEPSRVWRVGDRVRVVGAPFDGRVGAVSHITRFATVVVHLDGPKEGTQEYYHSADGTDLVAEPSPAGGRFKVGDRVRVRLDADESMSTREAFVGRTGTVDATDGWVSRDGSVILRVRFENAALFSCSDRAGRAYEGCQNIAARNLEPAPSPVSEAPAGESDEVVLKRCGWREARRGRVWMTGCFEHSSTASVWQTTGDTAWRWAPDDEAQRGMAPTLLQAACAALGIEIWCNAGYYEASREGVVFGRTERGGLAEDCARAALEAWSRR